jgi:excinuclease ABC subunit C
MLLEVPEDLSLLDAMLEDLPNRPAVFLLWPRQGEPYLARTALLRRRLLRLLRERRTPSRILNLRHTVTRIEYRLAASSLESSLLLYELARRHFPKTYLEVLKLRMPPYVKITLGNRFPRSQVTAQISGANALYFGPFRSRASAERFQAPFLDLFQMRRCEEELNPSPDHPGCIYGEMSMCLRPCQQVVGEDEYRHEVQRVTQFLATGGQSLMEPLVAARDRLSEELNFEEAARQHKRFEKIQEVLKLRDDLCEDISRLYGVAITASTQVNAVELWFFHQGCWQPPQSFCLEVVEGKSVSLDEKIRRTVAGLEWRSVAGRERQEHLALLARWYYSSWRDGEWLAFESPDKIPYRRLVRAISRIASKVNAAA